ncbi:hypothetical protein [Streptomyces virginiae]|uniref:hypothetical protein n=1 Tax=Streptomyces virginiae TaxID=1961 RepID=UPI0030E2EC47
MDRDAELLRGGLYGMYDDDPNGLRPGWYYAALVGGLLDGLLLTSPAGRWRRSRILVRPRAQGCLPLLLFVAGRGQDLVEPEGNSGLSLRGWPWGGRAERRADRDLEPAMDVAAVEQTSRTLEAAAAEMAARLQAGIRERAAARRSSPKPATATAPPPSAQQPVQPAPVRTTPIGGIA